MLVTLNLSTSSNQEHKRALGETGYWGRRGAGCVVQCVATGRLLMPLRSESVQEPNTWGTWGGAIDDGESPRDAALRELREESSYQGEILSMDKLYVYVDGTFTYTTFLVKVPVEFSARFADGETQKAKWTALDNMPKNLHKGMRAILGDSKARKMLHATTFNPR